MLIEPFEHSFFLSIGGRAEESNFSPAVVLGLDFDVLDFARPVVYAAARSQRYACRSRALSRLFRQAARFGQGQDVLAKLLPDQIRPQADPAFEKILSASQGPKNGGLPPLNPRTPSEEATGENEGFGAQARYFLAQLRQKAQFTVSASRVRKRIKSELGLDAGYSTVTRYLRKRAFDEKHARIARQAGFPGL
jgi:hypothetical protein